MAMVILSNLIFPIGNNNLEKLATSKLLIFNGLNSMGIAEYENDKKIGENRLRIYIYQGGQK